MNPKPAAFSRQGQPVAPPGTPPCPFGSSEQRRNRLRCNIFRHPCWLLFLCTLLLIGVVGGEPHTNKKVAVSEMVFDSSVSDIQWAGPEFKTVIVRTKGRRLFTSQDSGKTWTERTDDLLTASNADIDSDDALKKFDTDSVMVNSIDRNIVIVVGTKHTHLISKDATKTWKALTLRGTLHNYVFHPKRPSWGLLSTWSPACARYSRHDQDCYHTVYVTKDLGGSFKQISSYVVQYTWGDPKTKTSDKIYYTHHRHKKGPQSRGGGWSHGVDLAVTDVNGSSPTTLVTGGNKILVSNGYMFVAKPLDENEQSVSLLVSIDGGQTFKQSRLPQQLTQKSYTILDTSEGVVMIQATHGGDSIGRADRAYLYTSDASGERFSLSLPNNVKTSSGEAEFDKIQSLDGVYMANFRDTQHAGPDDDESEEQSDEELEEESYITVIDRHSKIKSAKNEDPTRTVISFDKGGKWHYLKPPKVDSKGNPVVCPSPTRCWLHLHGISNFHQFAPFYSTPNAVGIIMGTGNVGSQLRYSEDEVNTYISRDGGLTWAEAHKGAFIYEFGDHGGLMVMADDLKKTNQVVFSWNEGQSWYDFSLGSQSMEVDNIVIEPNSSSTEFLIYGTRDDSGVLYHLDFASLQQPLCKGAWAADSVSSDYETWSPSDGRRGGGNCLLGREIVYTRRKQTSECFNGKDFHRPVVKTNCDCTEEDFECDFGFTRKVESSNCIPDLDSADIMTPWCRTGKHYMADAYRKIPGDTCVGGWAPPQVAVPCPANSAFSRGAKAVLFSLVFVVVFVGFITYVSRSPELSSKFFNLGMAGYENVRYTVVGKMGGKGKGKKGGGGFSSLESSAEIESDDDAIGGRSPDSGGGTALGVFPGRQSKQAARTTAKGKASKRGNERDPEIGFIESAQEEVLQADPPRLMKYNYNYKDLSSDEDLFDIEPDDVDQIRPSGGRLSDSPPLSPDIAGPPGGLAAARDDVPRLAPPPTGSRRSQQQSRGGPVGEGGASRPSPLSMLPHTPPSSH